MQPDQKKLLRSLCGIFMALLLWCIPVTATLCSLTSAPVPEATATANTAYSSRGAGSYTFISQLSGDPYALQAYAQLQNSAGTICAGNIWVTSFSFTPGITAHSDTETLTAAQRAQAVSAAIQSIFAAVDAFRYDYPEYWMLDTGCSVYSSTAQAVSNPAGGYDFAISLSIHIATTAGNDTAFTTALNNVPITGQTRYAQLLSIHQYLCNTVTYDTAAETDSSRLGAHSAYGALIDGLAVCEGYAKAFKLLCDRADIPCVLVLGSGVTDSGTVAHMWNAVQMEDGQWYAVDVTWDDAFFQSTDFFLCGSSAAVSGTAFSDSHLASGILSSGGETPFCFTYPGLCAQRYAPASSAPVLSSVSSTQVTLQAIFGYEYRLQDGAWQQSNVFTGLTPGVTYLFYQRSLASVSYPLGKESTPLSVSTPKASPTQPQAPRVLFISDTGVVLQPEAGMEYRCGDGNWQLSNAFTALQPDTQYRFYCRIAGSGTTLESDASPALILTTGHTGDRFAYIIDTALMTVSGIAPGTTVNQFVAAIGGSSVSLYRNGLLLAGDDCVSTGAGIRLGGADYTAVVTGDLNGDGLQGISDLVQLKSSLLGTLRLSGVTALAADLDENGEVFAPDFQLLKNNLLANFANK